MPFLSLSLYNFRNLRNDKIDLSSKEVFFIGENGQGKSNLLESLYYSAYGSSFRTHTDSQIIKEKEFRNTFRELEVEYWSGKTGSGKTKTIMERYGYENVFRITSYRYPFDNYRGQDVVIFEEFHNSLTIQEMLKLVSNFQSI